MTEDEKRPRGPRPSFEVGPSLDLDALEAAFRAKRCLHIKEFLAPAAAEALYHALAGDFPWSTFLTADGRMYEAPYPVLRDYTEDQAQELVELAHRSARERGFGYAYDARALRVAGPDTAEASPPERLAALMSSEEVTAIFRRLCGAEIARVEVQAVRLRAGHFMSFHDTLIMGDKEGKCRALFTYDLTPEWRPEWGGMLAFRGEEGHLVEAHAPCFNCLDVFAVPQGRWLSTVSPFASSPAYSIWGSVHVR